MIPILNIPWEEFVLMAGNLVFIAALLPSVFSDHKPAFWTSMTTAPTLTLFSVAFFSLELYFSAVAVLGGALCWYTLAIQRWLIDRNK